MNGETACLLALICGTLGPASVLCARGSKVARFVGLQFAASALVPITILFAQVGQSYELVVPLVLVVLTFAGAMVFIRLLGAGGSDHAH